MIYNPVFSKDKSDKKRGRSLKVSVKVNGRSVLRQDRFGLLRFT
jgi:hypothetical protein